VDRGGRVGHGGQAAVQALAGDEARAEQGHLAAQDQDEVGAGAPQPLGPLCAGDEVLDELVRAEVVEERGEPHLQPAADAWPRP